MKEKFKYDTLEKHFCAPKIKVVHKRLPRKFKKKLNKFILEGNKFELLRAKNYDLNTKMWYLGWFINPDYNRFLIKEICKNKNNWKWN
jgi:hypothetical protein